MLSPGLHRRVKPILFKGHRVTQSPMRAVYSTTYSQRATQICILHQTYWFGNRAMHLYLGDMLCEYRPVHQIGSLIFVFLVLLQNNAGGSTSTRPRPFRSKLFSVYHSPYHLSLRNVNYWTCYD